jgi:hypothetical protein
MPIISWPTSVGRSLAFQASLSQLAQLQRIPKGFVVMPNPLPVYNVELRDLLLTADAGVAAKQVCWRYFANGNSLDTVIAGDVDLSSPPRVLRISYGSPVWDALQVASADHPQVPDIARLQYEPRLLRVPGLYIEAYWMRMLSPTAPGADTGWVIPYHMFQRQESPDIGTLSTMTNFSAQLMRFAGGQL